jgi:hypothetical protein
MLVAGAGLASEASRLYQDEHILGYFTQKRSYLVHDTLHENKYLY